MLLLLFLIGFFYKFSGGSVADFDVLSNISPVVKVGKSGLQFDGSQFYRILKSHSIFASDFTISFWYKPLAIEKKGIEQLLHVTTKNGQLIFLEVSTFLSLKNSVFN